LTPIRESPKLALLPVLGGCCGAGTFTRLSGDSTSAGLRESLSNFNMNYSFAR
jgi:hypothetical protein